MEEISINLLDTVDARFGTRRITGSCRSTSRSIEPQAQYRRDQRLQQVLNLLSTRSVHRRGRRAHKFRRPRSWSAEHPVLNHSPAVVAFRVSDTGISIPLEKQKLIFEAFQRRMQAPAGSMAAPAWGWPSAASLSLLGGEIHLPAPPAGQYVYALPAAGLRPAVLRLVPNSDTALRRHCRPRRRSVSSSRFPTTG
jgi:hypothetical protein